MLNIHSAFSLKYGMIMPKDLLALLQQLGYEKVAITDINNVSATHDFLHLSPRFNLQTVPGIDFRNGAQQCFVGIAKNRKGFKALNEYLSYHLHHHLPIPRRVVPMEDTYVIYPFSLFRTVENLESNEFIGVGLRDLNLLRFSPWLKHPEKLVMLHTMSFRNKRDFNTHRLLRAIDKNTLLSKLSKDEEGSEQDVFISKQDLYHHFRDFPALIRQTERVLADCSVDFSPQTNRNKQSFTHSVAEDKELLRKLCYEGLSYRYPSPDERVYSRIEKELDLVEKKGFISYFLINWDLLVYARSKGYFYVGRGSGANSILAYLLRITDVDPIELDLYFERFINLYRQNPPDFDIDFSWTDRDDITRYLFNRYPNVALLGVYNTFQYRGVIRELGKVFGLPKHEMDALSRSKTAPAHRDHLTQLIFQYGEHIRDLPNNLSIHSSGILISEEPIHSYSATFLPPKGYPTTQFDMVVAEDIGLYKFDILSQRGLSKIKETVETIKANNGGLVEFDIHDIQRFKSDQEIKKLLREGRTIGCFYVESPAMRMLLKKLLVDDYLGLVAASSIIRPGVSASGMMKEYILRHRFPEKRSRANPILLEIMPETYGVMVYQEDVIKVAHLFADLSLAEADALRRAMSGKFRSKEEFKKVEEKFFANCKLKNYPESMAQEVWRQIASFAGYAFAKGHSASYAVESYQSLFLKAYYPLEYLVATINNFGGFYQTESYVHEARMLGAKIHAPCINTSQYKTILLGKDIYLGIMHLSNLESSTAEEILAERASNGPFADLDDFCDRLPEISQEQLSLLVKIDAFRFTGQTRKALLWRVYLRVSRSQSLHNQTLSMFRTKPKHFELPVLKSSMLDDAFAQIELLGFPLCSPFLLVDESMDGGIPASQMPDFKDRVIVMYGYLVTYKETRTSKGERMHFGTFTDVHGQFIDSVHFPPVSRNFPFQGRGIYMLQGVVKEEFGFFGIEILLMRKLKMKNLEEGR